MLVKDIMTKNVISSHPWLTVQDAAMTMLENDIGGLPIIDKDENLVGMLTESDFIGKKVNVPHAMVSLTKLLGQTHYKADIQEIFSRAKGFKIEKVMTSRVYSLSPDATLTDANEAMVRNRVSRLPIVKDNKLLGIITKRDILKNFSFALSGHQAETSALAPS